MSRLLSCAALAALLISCVDAPDDEPADDHAVGTEAAAWEASSPTEAHRSTHLWIVDRAIEQLAANPATASLARLVSTPTCRTAWQQGLYDADFKAPYHDGRSNLTPESSVISIALSGATWASHFYDPTTGLNYKGQVRPSARTEALSHGSTAKARLSRGDTRGGCYELGLSLHYFTDLTQPMHASNFTAVDRPLKLHANVETYSMRLHDGTVVVAATTTPIGSPTAELEETALRANRRWPVTRAAIAAAYSANPDCLRIDWRVTDTASCWRDDPGVDRTIRDSIAAAPSATARFLRALDLLRLAPLRPGVMSDAVR